MKATRRTRRTSSTQLTLDQARKPSGHGGWRPGAGRPRGRTKVPHLTRARFGQSVPQHVTLRIRDGLSSLRRHHAVRIVRRAIQAGGHRDTFRIVQFSVQSNHLHLIVEASGAMPLARGMQGFEVRLARKLNRAMHRKGKLFAERYHARALRSPREVRNALRYVLCNARHHAAARGERISPRWIDPFSSAAWFDGWAKRVDLSDPDVCELLAMAPPTAAATVWLLVEGWRRHGPIAFDAVPGRIRGAPGGT
jgi:REP element-mobilizing transposase RayT